MNLKRSVWLPPDGDARLIRFQHQFSTASGRHLWAILPPYLDLDAGPPGDVVVTGNWVWEGGVPCLEASASGNRIGVFRFEPQDAEPWTSSARATLPRPPELSWRRGRLAVLELNHDEVWTWSWTASSGWSAPPKS